MSERQEREMSWNDAPTAPDLTEWLTSLTDEDWQDLADADTVTVERRKVAHRDKRDPYTFFSHLYDSGMTVQMAKAMTEEWLAAGGDPDTYTVVEVKPAQRADTRRPRSHFERLTTGRTERPVPWITREKWWTDYTPNDEEAPKPISRAMQLALEWRRNAR